MSLPRAPGEGRNRDRLTTLVFYLFLVLCPESRATVSALAEALVSALRAPRELAARFTTERAGEEQALPDVVQEMAALARARHVGSYRISDRMRSDATIFQRSVEGLWPIRMDANAKASFFLKGEEPKEGGSCRHWAGEEVVLVLCD